MNSTATALARLAGTNANGGMREAMKAARQGGGPPDMAAMMKMREQLTRRRDVGRVVSSCPPRVFFTLYRGVGSA